MRKLLLILGFVLPIGLYAQQQAEIVKLKQLQDHINRETDNIKIINFWATWCAPCIKEMPLFEKIGAERKDVEVTLVSLDLDLNPKPETVYRFIDRKKLQSKVLILDEKDPNVWINQIEKGWSGAIPATIIINGKTGQRKFVEKELHEGDLEKLIAEIL
jgi:thiol-disulfide isomerase/thioredoxin